MERSSGCLEPCRGSVDTPAEWSPSSDVSSNREREMFYLTTHSTHFIYGYMASDIWLRTILIARKETRCRHIGYSYRLTARVLLYTPSHRHGSKYHGLCYTSCGALTHNLVTSRDNKNGLKFNDITARQTNKQIN